MNLMCPLDSVCQRREWRTGSFILSSSRSGEIDRQPTLISVFRAAWKADYTAWSVWGARAVETGLNWGFSSAMIEVSAYERSSRHADCGADTARKGFHPSVDITKRPA